MSDIDRLKTQIKQVNELLQNKSYQNEGMRVYLEALNKRLKELEDVNIQE